MSLPVTVILPTRNAMGVVEAHLQAMRHILAKVEEIVVVDSSEDGTLEYLRGALAHPNIRFYSRPRGLYESWNFAVREATSEFIYFSTMGDIARRGGLEHLVEVARSDEADMVLSPPTIFRENGERHPALRWPIHLFCEQSSVSTPREISAREILLYSITWIPETLIGSSASNLYRRDFLSERPFPENWGNCADSAWMLTHGPAARVVVTPREIADFGLHAQAPGDASRHPSKEMYDDLYARAASSVASSAISAEEAKILIGWISGVKRRNELLRETICAKDLRIRVLDEKAMGLVGRIATADAQKAEIQSRLQKVEKQSERLREELQEIERRRHSLPRLVAWYFSRKGAPLRKLWDWLSGGSSGLDKLS